MNHLDRQRGAKSRTFWVIRTVFLVFIGALLGVALTHTTNEMAQAVEDFPEPIGGTLRNVFLSSGVEDNAGDQGNSTGTSLPIRADKTPRIGTAPTVVQTIKIVGSEGTTVPRLYTGTLRATRTSNVGFKAAGRVEAVLIDEGDLVQKGQLLAKLDVGQVLAQIDTAKARRDAALALLSELQAGPRSQEIAAAASAVEAAAAARDRGKALFDRTTRLIEKKAIAVQEHDNAGHDLRVLEKSLEGKQQVLEELEAGTRSEQIVAQEAVVRELESVISSLSLDLRERELRSPFDAVISKRVVDEGEVVAPGQMLARLVENSEPEAWIGLPVDVASELVAGQEVTLNIGDLSTKANLKAILPETDTQTRTLTAIFQLQPNDSMAEDRSRLPRFSSGQLVRLPRQRPTPQSGYWVPVSALSRAPNGLWSLYVVIDSVASDKLSSFLQRSAVEVVRIEAQKALVRGTIKEGDTVVAAGMQKLVPGQRVRTAQAAEAVGVAGDDRVLDVERTSNEDRRPS